MHQIRISTLLIFCLCGLALSAVSFAASNGPVKLLVGGQEVKLSTPCMLVDGTVFVPLEALPAIGVRVETNMNHRRDGQSIRVIPAVEREFTSHASLIEDQLMVPIGQLSLKIGVETEWSAESRTLNLSAKIDRLEFDGKQIKAVTSFPVLYDIYWWKGAKRLIVDLHGVQVPDNLPASALKNTTDVPIRTGMLSDGVTGRVVLDMPVPIQYRKGTFGKTEKIQVDILGYGPDAGQETSAVHRPGTSPPTPEDKPLPKPNANDKRIDVTDIQCRRLDEGHVEVHVSADKPIAFTTSMLTNPCRLVVDLPGAALAEKISDMQINKGALRGIRVSQFSDTTVRMTLDLSHSVLFKTDSDDDDNGLSVILDIPEENAGTLVGKVIVIDPGHGGRETGAIGCCGTLEKDVTLAIAKRVKKLLADAGASPFLTRETDAGLVPSSLSADLAERVDFAARHAADVFVCIHCNACAVPNSLSGAETYYHGQDPAGKELAQCVHGELIKAIGLHSRGVKSDTVRFASGMAVLRHSSNKYQLPAILVETGFINNAAEEAKLIDPEFQEKIAQGIVSGLKHYVEGKR